MPRQAFIRWWCHYDLQHSYSGRRFGASANPLFGRRHIVKGMRRVRGGWGLMLDLHWTVFPLTRRALGFPNCITSACFASSVIETTGFQGPLRIFLVSSSVSFRAGCRMIRSDTAVATCT